MFRIIGLKILRGCDPCIRKVLHEDVYYPLSASELNGVKSRLYDVCTDEGAFISVNVSAIVGKNGDGKSTIIEIILRILNNFSYALGFSANHESLIPVKGIRAQLYYELNGKNYCITADDNSSDAGVTWYQGNHNLLAGFNEEWSNVQRKEWLQANCEDCLFYTIVNNYSLYAYNSTIYKRENEGGSAWIESVFHKNDSYQTPIVISPMRMDGNMNVNKEFSLSRQRLLSLYTSARNDSDLLKIGDDAQAFAYSFGLERESKFEKETFYGYLERNRSKFVYWYQLSNNVQVPGVRNNNQISPLSDEALDNLTKHLCVFLRDLKSLTDHYNGVLPALENQQNRYKKIFNRNSKGADFNFYLTWLLDRQNPKKKRSILTKDMGPNVRTLVEKYNYTQLYRIILVMVIWEFLNQKYRLGTLENSEYVLFNNHRDPKAAAQLYLIYKLISILETYAPYNTRGYLYDYGYNLVCNRIHNYFKPLYKDLDDILARTDYVTLKFHQTVNYLLYLKDKPNDQFYPNDKQVVERTFEDLYHYVNTINSNCPLSEIKYYLPPPIFEGDIRIKRNQEVFSLSEMSSGELQLLNTCGGIVYHLRNLSDRIDRGISYNYVNLIIEEAELYFHPAYQREFIGYLLEQIKRGGIKNIKGINLCVVTHSPFVLSDVLPENVLCLKSGNIGAPNIRTFGANIHDLLRHPFFMNGQNIGNFAQKVINKIILMLSMHQHLKQYEAFDYTTFLRDNEMLKGKVNEVCDGKILRRGIIEEYSKETLLEMINLIDEPFVRNTLLLSYREIFDITDETPEERLLRQLNELTGKNYVEVK